MLTNEQYFWLELSSKKGLGLKTLKKLFKHFKSAQKICGASAKELASIGIHRNVLDALKTKSQLDIACVERYMESEGIQIFCLSDSVYPQLLREISDPPPVLFYKGSIAALGEGLHRLSVVGSRNCTAYAKQVLTHILRPIVSYRFSIVSGFAYGVDTLSHQVALREGILTVAVLGSGVSEACLYPAKNRELAAEIVKKDGILMSEFLPWQKSLPQFFVQRNRIIAGLSRATLVIEAAKKSGALITADMALGFSRDVAAVPGSIFSPVCEGTHSLLAEGAVLIQSSSDILRLFDIEEKGNPLSSITQLTCKEEKVFSLMKEHHYSTDELSDRTNFTIQEIHSIVSLLEIKGFL